METIMRRAASCALSVGKVMFMMLWFFFSIGYDRAHPLESGYFRLKFRRERRPTLPRESMLVFYPRFAWDTVRSHFWMGYWILRMNRVRRRIHADVARRQYTDLALSTASGKQEFDTLSLFTETRGVKALSPRSGARALHGPRFAPVALWHLDARGSTRGDHVNLSSHRDRWGPRADLFPAQSL
jgi:hypothetical protein